MKNIKNRIFLAMITLVTLSLSSCYDTEKDFQTELVTYPEITVTSFSPQAALSGEYITIEGNHFGDFKEAAKIYFNGIFAEHIVSYSNTQITVAVPAKATTGKIQVDVWGDVKETTDTFTFIPGAKVDYYLPSIASAGENITIVGDNFGTDSNAITISFNGGAHAEIISITNTEIVVSVPFAGRTGPITLTKGVQVLVGPEFSYPIGRLKFLFDTDNDFETIESFNNPGSTGMSVSGGSLTGTFDSLDGYFGFQTPTGKELTVSSEFPLLAIKLDHLPASRFGFYFAGGWYANNKTGFEHVPNPEINDQGVYYFDLSTSGSGFGSSAVQPFANGATTYTDTKRLIFLLGDAGNTSLSVDWIISFKSVEDLKNFIE
ncbi:IPT/TIG domain-containing protein [Mariniflexile ostreae]|uniref:IPT/TIG domain-containing protein n=1 Tax=Mariniflexile ostreae TaxID=1520892 RepID=A0ABV5FD04_9FLAO